MSSRRSDAGQTLDNLNALQTGFLGLFSHSQLNRLQLAGLRRRRDLEKGRLALKQIHLDRIPSSPN